jgi:TRAP-type C4-dicarboxylate transport system permease small subunit
MKVLKKLAEALHKVSNVCVWISGISLFFIAAFIFVDVFARYFFNKPITGSQEIVELVIVVVLYLGLPYSTYKRSHVRVDALTSLFPPRGKLICLGIMTLLCMLVSGPIAVQLFRQALNVMARGTASNILKIPHWPFYLVSVFGNIVLTFEFLCDGIRYFIEAANYGKDEPSAEAGKEETT